MSELNSGVGGEGADATVKDVVAAATAPPAGPATRRIPAIAGTPEFVATPPAPSGRWRAQIEGGVQRNRKTRKLFSLRRYTT